MRNSTILVASLLGLVAGCGDNDRVSKQPDAAPMTPDAATCTPPAVRPQLDTLMSGDLVIPATGPSDVAPVTVDQAKSILFITLRESEASPQYGAVTCALQDADPVAMTPAGVKCKRAGSGTDTPGSDGVITVHWTVATFTSGVSVQRGSTYTGVTNPQLVSLPTPADPASSFVLLGGMIANGGGWGNNEFFRARLLDSSTLELRNTIAGSESSWQVVTMTSAFVQRGTTALATADTEGQVPLTGQPGTLALVTYGTDNASSVAAAQLMLQGTVDGNNLKFKRGMGGAALDVAWEVVRVPFFSKQVTTSFAAGEAMKTEAIAGLPAATSVALASNEAVLGQSSGSTDYQGASFDLLGEAAATLTVANGNVTLERKSSTANASITWTVIDFGHDPCASM